MSETHSIIASFKDTPSFYHAAEKVRDAGYKKWDTYSSFPVHGMPAAQGQGRSKVPVFTFCGGLLGFVTGTFLVWYMNAYDYPLIVGQFGNTTQVHDTMRLCCFVQIGRIRRLEM